jgi:hypothetical protein
MVKDAGHGSIPLYPSYSEGGGGRLRVQRHLGQKSARPYLKNKLGIVVKAYNPS